MDEIQDFPEESLVYVKALLRRHPPHYIHRMIEQVANSRHNSTALSSTSSRFPVTSSYSASSSEYKPSLTSLSSSRSWPRQEPTHHAQYLDPTRPLPRSVPSPVSEVCSPVDPYSETSIIWDDCHLDRIASPIGFRNENYFFCTFCPDLKTFRARRDWKMHEKRMHETGEDWPCPAPGCGQIFNQERRFARHYERCHPGQPLLSMTDIRIRLLPQKVFGCGFDKCKDALIGWDKRCAHVADHMKKGMRFSQWKYSNVIRNLIRQEATRDAWEKLFSSLDDGIRKGRSQICWNPDNTRVLRQKLECCDLRPSLDEVLLTALCLRSDLPLDPALSTLPAGFVTPSEDSIPNFHHLSSEQRIHILNGNPTVSFPRARLDAITAGMVKASNNTLLSYVDIEPDNVLDLPIPDLPIQHDTAELSFMPDPSEAGSESGFIDPVSSSNPFGWANYFNAAPSLEESRYFDWSDIVPKKARRKVRSGLSLKQSHPTHEETNSEMQRPKLETKGVMAELEERDPEMQHSKKETEEVTTALEEKDPELQRLKEETEEVTTELEEVTTDLEERDPEMQRSKQDEEVMEERVLEIRRLKLEVEEAREELGKVNVPLTARLCSFLGSPLAKVSSFSCIFPPKIPAKCNYAGKTVRINWICSCGHCGYDDFIELKPGAIERLLNKLVSNGALRSASSGRRPSVTQNLFRIAWNWLISITNNFRFGKTPQNLLASSAGSQQRVATAQSQSPSHNSDFLLLCIKNTKYSTALRILEARNMKSDQELFHSLRSLYLQNSCFSIFSLQTLKQIRFVQFVLRKNSLVDRLECHILPPPTATHYGFSPRPPDLVPPIGEDYMMHRFSVPHDGDGDNTCLNQIPKRLGQRPDRGVPPDNHLGWGLYFVEGPHLGKVYGILAIVIATGSLLFGILYFIFQRDVQGAFTVAAYITSLLTLLVGTWQMWILTS
ncbi:hypothetical protein K469DRAFT_627030 [Zopfia rhizophila CBS 207.26]|uniref:C2H2-type domain-containing protein n=1 Tax=Zopfia rhizophila CBS 207.26 TaxID=1314779 RepID=A0A6A6EBM2_9PEZI|nr:hypothetical protein K469DRAFT_627030 [Zopfia rhizophila CBS 207.26]